MLELSTLNDFPNRVSLPQPPIIINGEPKYKILEVLDFKIGDKVFVKSDNIQTMRLSKKLSEQFLGPFKIMA